MEGMEGFRVKLDLRACFKDYRRKSLIFVNPIEVQTVSRLKKHIKKLFYIPDEIELFLAGNYIPSSECIGIIREDDTIEIRSTSSNPIDSTPLEEPYNKLKECLHGKLNEEVVEKKKKKCKKRKREVHDESGEMPVEVDKSDLVGDVTAVCTSLIIPKKKKRKSSNRMVEVPEEHNALSFICDGEEEKQTPRKKSIEKDLVTEHEHGKDTGYLESNVGTLITKINDSISVAKKKISKFGFAHSTLIKDSTCKDMETKEEIIGTESKCQENTEQEINEEMLNKPMCESHQVGLSSEKKRKRRRQRRKNKHEKLFSASTPRLNYTPPSMPMVPCVKSQFSKKVKDEKLHLRFSDSEEGESITSVATAILDVTKESEQKEKHNIEIKENSSEDFAKENSRNAALENTVCELMETKVQNDNGGHLTKITDNIEKGNVNSVKILNKELSSHKSITYESISKASSDVNDLNKCDVKEDLTYSGSTSSDNKSNTACVSMHKRIKNRGKKVIINKGMGVTLAHLMKESRGNFEGDLDKNPACPVEPIVPSIVPDLDQTLQKDNKDQKYKIFPIIEKYPKVGDFLAFKILKLNHKYEPCLSDYMKGTVCNCNEELQSKVTVRVLEGASELKKTIGKFDLEGEEETEGNENDNIIELEWKEFVEPRLLYP